MADKAKNPGPASRTERRADALRENLRRRKLQARSRGAASGKAQGRPEEPSGPDKGKH